jgi:hypothetical protein
MQFNVGVGNQALTKGIAQIKKGIAQIKISADKIPITAPTARLKAK